ncbi:MAG: metal-sensitive transcriptional regulator [Fimbriimonadales bacterium]
MTGQVSGLAKMVEEDRYCVDILTQVAALRAALENLGALLLTAHVEECMNGDQGSLSDLTSAERVEEVRVALSRFLK